jgi:hypothetical protein
MRTTQALLSAEEQDLLTEVMHWASLHHFGPAHTAELLARVTRAIQMAILHLDGASDLRRDLSA